MKIVVFSGAGISRESGLKTFRDSDDGLWEGHDVMAVASIQGWLHDPQQVLEFYNARRRDVLVAEPNEAHLVLAELEKDHDVTVITQNVDDLHERAGSTNVIHLHGEVLKARPAYPYGEAGVVSWRHDLNLGDCDSAGVQLRPHIVWFGEGLPELDQAIDIALGTDVDVLIVVGTSLNVFPAAMIATETRARKVYLVDPEPPALRVPNLTVIPLPASAGVRQVAHQIVHQTF